eukprot:gene25535-29079_t
MPSTIDAADGSKGVATTATNVASMKSAGERGWERSDGDEIKGENRGEGERDAVAEAAAAAVALILPPPPAVQHWQTADTADGANGKPKSDLAREATEWLVNA